MKVIFNKHLLIATAMFCLGTSSWGQVVLSPSGGTYTETFTGLGTQTLNGWFVSSNGSATSVGTLTNVIVAGASGDTSANFRSMSDAPGVLAVRQTGAVESGVGFYLRLSNTTDLENFSFTLNAGNYSNQPRTSVYTVQWGLGASPTSWTTLGTISSDAAPANYTYSNLAGIADQSGPVFFRVIALGASTGTGNRDTFGINSASLTYTAAVPEPSTYALLALGGVAFVVFARRRKTLVS